MMKDKKIKKKWLIVFSVLLILILVAFFAIYLPWKHRVKAPITSSNTNTTSEGGVITNSQVNRNSNSVSADDYYQNGLNQMNNKEYEKAISSFDQASQLDPNQIQYYDSKSVAEYLNKDTAAAINTLEVGIEKNPNDAYLKSRLDVLKNNQLGSQPQ